jgi:hypothetical protein
LEEVVHDAVVEESATAIVATDTCVVTKNVAAGGTLAEAAGSVAVGDRETKAKTNERIEVARREPRGAFGEQEAEILAGVRTTEAGEALRAVKTNVSKRGTEGVQIVLVETRCKSFL